LPHDHHAKTTRNAIEGCEGLSNIPQGLRSTYAVIACLNTRSRVTIFLPSGMTHLHLVLPCPVYAPASKHISVLQSTHCPPFLSPRTVHVTTWLNAKPAALAPCRYLLSIACLAFRYIRKPSSVELESGFSAFNFKMQPGVRMEKRSKCLHGE